MDESRSKPNLKLKPINPYPSMIETTYKGWAFNEDEARGYKGKWQSEVFFKSKGFMIDLEIGTGIGHHFAFRASENLNRGLLGIEKKYKPLVQSIKRALKLGAKKNAFMIRYDATRVKELFSKEEIHNVYIHHPDPWPKKRHWRRRLIQEEFLKDLYYIMKKGGFVEFKTDDETYYEWSLEAFKCSCFHLEFKTKDLHGSTSTQENFITHFEKIFIKKGQPIFYLKAFKA